MTKRPDACTEEMLDYLDDLRIARHRTESGVTNMFGAAEYLDREFPELRNDYTGSLTSPNAKAVLSYWMATFPRKETE